MVWKTLDYAMISDFKRFWPCHGLPVLLNEISFEFASNGDLIDIKAKDIEGNTLDTAEFDGPALVAMSKDAQEFGNE